MENRETVFKMPIIFGLLKLRSCLKGSNFLRRKPARKQWRPGVTGGVGLEVRNLRSGSVMAFCTPASKLLPSSCCSCSLPTPGTKASPHAVRWRRGATWMNSPSIWNSVSRFRSQGRPHRARPGLFEVKTLKKENVLLCQSHWHSSGLFGLDINLTPCSVPYCCLVSEERVDGPFWGGVIASFSEVTPCGPVDDVQRAHHGSWCWRNLEEDGGYWGG
ncbi:uncharacterized protein LOC134513396 isoform X1 [Chroicocephalus ridibundus]|uniref:uncharacterized protein LOC134513396 isoform X1 n=1 Tax=Chroicocephalus ridibundus TaxID=1192867 RepID=UPI002FDD4D87